MLEFNRRFNDNDLCWLVKVDTHISGPFSFNEIIAKLTSGTLSYHHEAALPMDRWRTLQSQPVFAAAIEKMRRQHEETHEHTLTKTEKSSFTRTLDISSDRLTPTPMRETLTPPPASMPPLSPSRVYSDGPSRYKQHRPQAKAWPVVLAAAAVVILIGLFYTLSAKRPPQQEQEQKKSDFFEYFDTGLERKKVAAWQEALRNFKLAYQFNNKDIDLILEMTPLLIQIDGQTGYARSLLEKIIGAQYKKENLAIAKNIIGLSYSYENQTPGHLRLALKHYDEVNEMGSEDNYTPALINKAYAHMLNSEYAQAEALFIQAAKSPTFATLAYLYLLESYLVEGVKTKNRKAFEKAFQLSGKLIKNKVYDGAQELQLFHAFAAYKLGKDANSVLQYLQNSLMVDPDQTSDHLHPALIDWRPLNWKNFSFICADFSKLAQHELYSLLSFVCAYKMQGVSAAQEATEAWMIKNRSSSQAYVARALLSYSLNDNEKAKDSLLLAEKLGAQDKLYFQVRAKVCARLADTACLREMGKVLARFSTLQSLTALAAAGDKQSLLQGLKESPNYIPLLKMQR